MLVIAFICVAFQYISLKMSTEFQASESSLTGKVVLITGASFGIGADVSVRFATFGTRLALVARNKADWLA